MNFKELQTKWDQLPDKSSTNGFRSLRISSECVPELFIGVNKDANRCLVLSLPPTYKINFQGVSKENLKIEYFTDTNLIVLQLTDNTFYDLFDDLVISLYQRMKDLREETETSKEFIQTFFKWSEFFEDQRSDQLGEEIIKGLFGELLFMEKLLEVPMTNVNSVLESWKGPFDKGHDFELDRKDIEVKTKDFTKLDISISSEYQLEKSFGKDLELVVVSVERDHINGYSLEFLINRIRTTVKHRIGDSSILLRALNQKGLSFKTLKQYDEFRFRPIDLTHYNCTQEGFPKLIRTVLPNEINSVRYNLRLNSLSQYIISTTNY